MTYSKEDFPQPDPSQAHRMSGTLVDARALAERAAHDTDPVRPVPIHAE